MALLRYYTSRAYPGSLLFNIKYVGREGEGLYAGGVHSDCWIHFCFSVSQRDCELNSQRGKSYFKDSTRLPTDQNFWDSGELEGCRFRDKLSRAIFSCFNSHSLSQGRTHLVSQQLRGRGYRSEGQGNQLQSEFDACLSCVIRACLKKQNRSSNNKNSHLLFTSMSDPIPIFIIN